MDSAREATADDLDYIAVLLRRALSEPPGVRGGPMYVRREGRGEPVEPTINELLDNVDSKVLVGLIDEVVVGFAIATVETLRDGEKHGVLSEIYVEPEARAVGVGEAMLVQIEDWLRSVGAKTVDSFALPGDRNTKNFFETFGYRARLIVTTRNLDESSD